MKKGLLSRLSLLRFDDALVRTLLADCSVLWLFLVPPMLARLRPIIDDFLQKRKGRRVISYRSPILGLTPADTDRKMVLFLYEHQAGGSNDGN